MIHDSNSVPYRSEIQPKDEYLYAFVEGQDSFETSETFWFELLEECKDKNYSKLLIEENLEGELSSSETYELSVKLAKSDYKNLTVAFVDRQADHKDSNKYGETIVTNRGVRIKVFDDLDVAKQWLLAG